MSAEASMGPGQQVRHHLLVIGALVQDEPQDLVPEELLKTLRVGGGTQGEEDPVPCEEAPGDHIQNLESIGGAVVNVTEETTSGFAWQFLAGVNVDLAPNLSADLAYRYFGTNPGFSLIDVDYRTQAVTFELNFHF
jgi:opacity protein-like surface antigen